MYDFLIVGGGLAGISFTETALSNGKTVYMISDTKYQSSKVAAGLYNPLVLKRFTEIWHAKQQIDLINTFYSSIEQRLNIKIHFPLPIYRKFASVEEQNNWFVASDKPSIGNFLDATLIKETFGSVTTDFQYGKVNDTGYVDTKQLLQAYHSYLIENQCFESETFAYEDLVIELDHVTYKNIKAKHIIFAEGFGMHNNPYFKGLPLDGTKGELLVIKSSALQVSIILKAGLFILPLGNDLYKVGATYNWKDKTPATTSEGKAELIEKLNEIINCDYEITEHLAEVRPTVRDRRPLVGTHPTYYKIHILNGLGTRGVMLGPYLAKWLYGSIVSDIPLHSEIDIKRIKA